MKDDVFTVHFIPTTNCFLHLPELSLQNLLRNVNSSKCCLQMKYGNSKCAYFTWSPQAYNSHSEHSVGISAVYARALGLREHEEIILSCIKLSLSVNKMKISVVSSDDWDVMEMSLNAVQSSLLNQIRVVWPGQTFVVWVSKYLHISLRVDSLEPNSSFGLLETFTDLVVSPPEPQDTERSSYPPSKDDNPRLTSNSMSDLPTKSTGETTHSVPNIATNNHKNNILHNRTNTFWDTILNTLLSVFSSSRSNLPFESKEAADAISTSSPSVCVKYPTVPYRVHPLETETSVIDKTNNADLLLCHPFNVFVHKCHLRPEIVSLLDQQKVVVCKVSKMVAGVEGGNEPESSSRPKFAPPHELYARLFTIEQAYKNLSDAAKRRFHPTLVHSEHRCVLVSKSVQRALKIHTGARVHLVPELEHEVEPIGSTDIEIITTKNVTLTNEELKSVFQNYLRQFTRRNSLLLNSKSIVSMQHSETGKADIFIFLSLREPKFALFDSISAWNCNIGVNVARLETDVDILQPFDEEHCFSTNFFGHTLGKLIHEGSLAMQLGLGLRPSLANRGPSFTSNILIVGHPGSGKSTISRHLCESIAVAPHFVHSVVVECSHLKGKTVEALHKLLSQWVAECIAHQPAVLLLDDVDSIVGVSTQTEEHSAEAAYTFRVGEMLSETLKQVQRRNFVLVVATAPSVMRLSPSVAAPRGQHFFKCILQIPDLTKQDRVELLRVLITEKTGRSASTLSLECHASKAEGYVVQDICDMVDKAVFEAWKRDDAVTLRDDDVEAAMANTVPLSLRGVTLYKDSEQSWDDVGGLTDVKRILIEALQWPSQYMELFSQCPLRHQSGLLLYGAPGTGKTLLAGAVARECGLNFISVKGPELLSKYIGASEEAVRSIFQKAQSAQPCVLFFDEFDSLAPRRGHDSTGVTDRVVNQLLTQLDGVESLVGVWVLAATSRPDLLDPALLRPGRLDRAVYCALPTCDERDDILRAQARRLRLAPDVDLAQLAQLTDGFTGADLRAVLATAHMAALEETLENVSPEDADVQGGAAVEVTQAHLVAALQDTRPSLTPEEKLRYQVIYDKFVGARKGKSREVEVVSQRITLA